jgi:hypothetical protein
MKAEIVKVLKTPDFLSDRTSATPLATVEVSASECRFYRSVCRRLLSLRTARAPRTSNDLPPILFIKESQ